MPSTYTTNNGIELIGTGEQTGTWGDTTNTNFELIDVALDGQATITLASAGTSGSPNTLPITDGVASNGRNRALIFTDGGDLGATAYVQLTPDDAEKIIFVRNSLSGSRDLVLFQGTYNAANDFVLAAGKDAIVKFDGGGTGAVASALLEDLALDAVTATTGNITTVNATTVDTTNLEVTNLKAKDGTSAGSIANSTGVVTLASSVLTTTDINGGTIDGATIGGSSAAAGTFTTLTATGNVTLGNAATDTVTVTADVASDLIPSADGMYDLGASGSEWQDLYIDGTANIDSLVADTADINGGTIDGATIGGSTAAAGSFTTLSASGSLSANSFTVGQANAADVPMAVYSTDANCIISLNDDSTTSTSHVGVQAVGDNLALRAGSAQRVYVASDGDVGIGTTNPLAQLHSFNTGSPYAAMMESNQTSSSVVFASSGSSNKYHQGINTGDGTDMRIFAGNAARMTVTSSGNVGIGTTSPVSPLHISGAGDIRSRVESTNSGDSALDLMRTGANSYRIVNDGGFLRIQNGLTPADVADNDRFVIAPTTGRVGINNSSPTEILDVVGNVTISGSLSKGSGSFKIDHPIKPETHHLVHSFVEGPQADNIYRGRVTLVAGGATVNLDLASRMTEGTFVALNCNVQCFTSNEDGWTQVRGKVQGNLLTIEAQDPACTDEVSWMVIGERHDQHMIDASWTDENGRIIVEPEKPDLVEE